MTTRAAAPGHGRRPARRLPALLAALLPWAAPAQVQDAGDYLRRMDLDGDGRVAPEKHNTITNEKKQQFKKTKTKN